MADTVSQNVRQGIKPRGLSAPLFPDIGVIAFLPEEWGGPWISAWSRLPMIQRNIRVNVLKACCDKSNSNLEYRIVNNRSSDGSREIALNTLEGTCGFEWWIMNRFSLKWRTRIAQLSLSHQPVSAARLCKRTIGLSRTVSGPW